MTQQALTADAVAQKQVNLWKEQHQSVVSARREANTAKRAADDAKRAADDLRQELARSEKR